MENGTTLVLQNNNPLRDYFLNDQEKPIKYLPNTSKINIIVGANNSGKSRFIRNLMTQKSFMAINTDLLKEYNLVIEEFNSRIKEKAGYRQEYLLDELNFVYDIANHIIVNSQKLNNQRFGFEREYVEKISNIDKPIHKELKEFKKYYIPVLRTAHSLFDSVEIKKYKKVQKDIYSDTLNFYYNLDKEIDVFTGMNFYKEVLTSRNSEKTVRKKFENFESFLSKNFFNGKQIDIVAKFDKNENEQGNDNSELILIHVEGEEITSRLFELGDGIQALIILMYKIFMAEDNSIIFIDEPELNLHPGMQRLFLEKISEGSGLPKNLTYFITTHSNHLLDLTLEKDKVSIYSFSLIDNKNLEATIKKQFVIKNVNRGDNNLLRELGVNNSSVFMANCSIWVEGISDRNYIKTFLKSYCNSKNVPYPKEDIDFAFFEYAGSNIDHYLFGDITDKEELILEDIKALALSNRIFLLADSDAVAQASKKEKRLKSLESSRSDNFVPKIIYGFREIENLITNDMWKKILIDFCNERLVKENEESIQAKIEDALKKIDYSEYKNKYIGAFLNALREEIGKIGSTYILNKSLYETKKDGYFGTIINKRNLSEILFDKQFPWEILSKNKEIETLTIEIYKFITSK